MTENKKHITLLRLKIYATRSFSTQHLQACEHHLKVSWWWDDCGDLERVIGEDSLQNHFGGGDVRLESPQEYLGVSDQVESMRHVHTNLNLINLDGVPRGY